MKIINKKVLGAIILSWPFVVFIAFWFADLVEKFGWPRAVATIAIFLSLIGSVTAGLYLLKDDKPKGDK